jgi:stearoyl-CoA desaturase (delta-9 desaturase)
MSSLPIYGLIGLPLAAVIIVAYQAFTGDVSMFNVVMCIVGVVLTEFGITFAYHRMVVHKAFEAHPVIKAITLAFGSMAFQGPVLHWASVHTKHHAHSDQEGDPHSPTIGGFIHAHFEWLLEMNSTSLDEVIEKWGSRYKKDPMLVWFTSTFLFWAVLSLIIPAVLGYMVGGWHGAWTGFLWGGLVRIFISSHVTWSVNSVCHYFGARTYTTTDHSRNNPIVGLLALGEGWHNNHHAFPASAFHGLAWWQLDVTGLSIALLEKLGLVSKVTRVPETLMTKRRIDSQTNALNVQTLALTEEEEVLEEA